MEVNNIIVDPVHFLNSKLFIIKRSINNRRIYVAEEYYKRYQLYLIKKSEDYILETKSLFINQVEKSFELVHPSVINLSGYSIEKPYLFYKYSKDPLGATNIKISDENAQKIFLGIASGLSYLLSKGYYYTDFTYDCVILDNEYNPMLIDYIDFENQNKSSEKDMISKYVDLLKMMIKEKIEKSSISINEELKTLFKRSKQQTNSPTFNDFINFFMTKTFRKGNSKFIHSDSFQKYLKILQFHDKIIFDDFLMKNIGILNKCDNLDTTEKVFYYFLKNKDLKVIDNSFLLNSLPDYYIKLLIKIIPSLSKNLSEILYIEDISLSIPDWQNFCDLYSEHSPFKIYILLMNHIKELEKQKDIKNEYIIKNNELDYQIGALKSQAVIFLKRAVKQSNDVKISIELAVQYIKNDILPYNLNKALFILDNISNADKQTNILIEQMKDRIKSIIKSTSIDVINQSMEEKQRKILHKAEQGDILSLLYAGFAFYVGFNGFEIARSLSIHYYRTAAKKSPDAMFFLGYLYFYGIFFPQNFKRAKKCFKRASDRGSLKSEIIDSFLRKHSLRTYLAHFDLNELLDCYFLYNASTFLHCSMVFPKIIYYLENNMFNDKLYIMNLFSHAKNEEEKKLNKLSKKMHLDLFYSEFNESSSSESITCSNDNLFYFSECIMFVYPYEVEKWCKKIKPAFSEKILLNHEKIANTKDVKKQIFIAKSYFYGDNNFPVNYTKAAEFFRCAADNGDSEAQWRYAMMLINSIGCEYNVKAAKHYFQESSKQNDINGKFYYALFIMKYENDHVLFEKLIKDCCDSEHLDAMCLYAKYLEKNNSDCIQYIDYYKKAADKGHFDSLIRLLDVCKNNSQELFENYLELSVGILNEKKLIELIKLYDKNEKYELSASLIQIGLKMNYESFIFYYIDYLLYGKGMPPNIKRAKNLAIIAFQKNYGLYDKRIYSLLQAFVINNEHKNALKCLLKYNDELSIKYREDFHLFYKKFDKNLARKYFIPACYYYKEYIDCHNILMEFHEQNKKETQIFKELYAEKVSMKENSFAFAIIGKFYKHGKLFMRDLNKAVYYFARSAELECPLGYYYIGKEYFYGRYLIQDYDKAKEYLLRSMRNNDEPRACYYIYKISNILKNTSLDDIKMLKIGVEFEHKKALYKYGHLLYKGNDSKIEKNESEGIKFIQRAAFQNHKKAIKFCISHGIIYKKNEEEDFLINDDQEIEKYSSENSFNHDLNKKKKQKNLDLFFLDENDNKSSQQDEQSSSFHTTENNTSNSKHNSDKDDMETSDSINLNQILENLESSFSESENNQNDLNDNKKNSMDIDNKSDDDDDSTSNLFGFWF